MIRSILISAFVVGVLVEGSPTRFRRDEKVEQYCSKHEEHYNKYCSDLSVLDRALHTKLAKFCPAYEKHCGKGDSLELPESDSLVVPPPLPKGGDFAALDLPIGASASAKSSPANKTRLTAAIIASCTPDCTAAHCTDECKCAHTHPKVHAMCNPPANAQLANTCQKWYDKCPMFQPVQYY